MKDPIELIVRDWDINDRDPETNVPRTNFPLINVQIRYLSEKLFEDYEPTKGACPDFLERLVTWLGNTNNEEDKKLLFQIIPYIFFVGREEFETLYRVAFNGPIARWFIEELAMPLNEREAGNVLKGVVDHTWFCPITDSLHISSFCHINRITGVTYRPDWFSLSKFGDTAQLEAFMREKNIQRIVLLEDFVGSGTQVSKVVKFVAEKFGNIRILYLPLIIAPKGHKTGIELETQYSNVSFSSVISLNEAAFVIEIPSPFEPVLFSKIREFCTRIYPRVSGATWPHDGKPFGPFGYNGTGGLIVMYSNCPDNTLPIIHYESSTWKPLFPRSTRV